MDSAQLPHSLNWIIGWFLLMASFMTGAALGLGFHRPEFMGGYGSFSRRLARLGHIACAALGMLNILFGLGPLPEPGTTAGRIASLLLVAGGVLMPAVCFLTAWRRQFRHLFALPVVALMTGVGLVAFSAIL